MKQKACNLKFTAALGFHGKTFSGWQAGSFLEWSRNTRVYNKFVESVKQELSLSPEKPRIVIYGAGMFGQALVNVIEGDSLADVVAVVDDNRKYLEAIPGYDFFDDIDRIKVALPVDFIVISTNPARYEEIVTKITSSKTPAISKETTILFMFDDFMEHTSSGIDLNKKPSKIVVSTLQKSGTIWLSNMLKSLLIGDAGFENVFNPRIPTFHQAWELKDKQYTHGHFAADDLSYFFHLPDYKFIFLYRDLRDQVTSLHLFHKYRKHPDHPYSVTLKKMHRYLEYFTEDESLSMHIEGIRTDDFHIPSVREHIELVKEWKAYQQRHPNIYLLTYEALHKDTYAAMRGILSFLNINIDGQTVKAVIEDSSFKKMSKGRSEGSEDSTSHQRKGIIGDWKNHFTDGHKKLFKAETGDFLIEAGYETDNSW